MSSTDSQKSGQDGVTKTLAMRTLELALNLSQEYRDAESISFFDSFRLSARHMVEQCGLSTAQLPSSLPKLLETFSRSYDERREPCERNRVPSSGE